VPEFLPLTRNTTFDIIIVLGKNWVEYPPNPLPPDWKLELSLESKISALAAGEMFIQENTDTIIFSTGKTAGKEWPSEAAAMREFMLEYYPNIPLEKILLEEESIDTVGNAEEVAKMLKEWEECSRIGLVTIGYHLARSVKIFRRAGLKVIPIASEDLIRCDLRHFSLLKKFESSNARRIEYVKEFILRMILRFDPDGRKLRLLTKKLRHAE